MKTTFTLYAEGCQAFGGVPSDHCFVGTDDGHDFNCFGRGTESVSGARPICKGTGSSKWAALFYGTEGGPYDAYTAAGLHVRYDGVCHTAANRVLVLTGDNVDARTAEGNALAILMFGKFGFNLQPYIDSVTSTAQQMLRDSPGEIQPEDLQTVLNRIAYGQTAEAELDILHADVQEQLKKTLPDVTGVLRETFCAIYGDYQRDRSASFLEVAKTVPVGEQIALNKLPKALAAPWTSFVERLSKEVGADQFKNILGIDPEFAKKAFGAP